MTIEIVSPLKSTANREALRRGLVAYLARSGMPLPEDENILDYIQSSMRFGNMRAVLAVAYGDAIGIVAWRVEGDAGFVVLFCVLPGAEPRTAELLLAEALCDMRPERVPRGIYAELPELSSEVRAALESAGFVGVERAILQCDLRSQADVTELALPPGYRLQHWEEGCLEAGAEVIYRANVGTVDAMIIPELQTLPGTLRIVRQCLQGRYGTFDARASGLIQAGPGHRVGVTLVTRRHGGMGFTAEICVLPEHRRRGLARSLMQHTHGVLRSDGVAINTLGVTVGNPARFLYDSLGFQPLGGVWTYVWPRPQDWPNP